LVLLSLCAYGGVLGEQNKSTGIYYVIGLVALLAIGAGTIAQLARGIVRNPFPAGAVPGANGSAATSLGSEVPTSDALPRLSPASRDAIRLLVYAIAAQIGLGALTWLWALRGLMLFKMHPGMWAPVASGIAADLPYIVIAYYLLTNPGRRTFAYALAVPAILIFFGIFSSVGLAVALTRSPHPLASLALVVPWALHILIFKMAWRAIRQIGIHPDHKSLAVAAVVAFFYFSLAPTLGAVAALFAERVL
jgi:hypothetical protein